MTTWKRAECKCARRAQRHRRAREPRRVAFRGTLRGRSRQPGTQPRLSLPREPLRRAARPWPRLLDRGPRSPILPSAPRAAVGRGPSGKAVGLAAVCCACARGRGASGVGAGPRMCTVCPVGRARSRALSLWQRLPGTPRERHGGPGLAWGSSPGRQRLGRPGRAGLKLGVRLGGGGREAGRRSRPEQRGPRGQEAAQGAGGMGWRTGRRRGGPVELTGRAGSLAGRLVRPLGQQDRRGRGWRGLGRAGAEPGRGAQLRGFRGAVWKAGRPTLVVCHENRARRRWRPASSRGVGWGPLTGSRARPLSPRLGDGPGASEALVTSRACGPGQPRRGPSRHGATRQVAENGAAAA